ncbi:MAG: hypothetical protein WAM14_27560 [Candidatus Nitrosopolaris sp.]
MGHTRSHRSVYPMPDLAAMPDMDDATNDDATNTVRGGGIPDSHHRQALPARFFI